MPSQKGRDLLLKIGNGATPEVFLTIGAARTVSMQINNQPADATATDSNGLQTVMSDGGVQSMHLSLDGVFKDSDAEALLQNAAFARTLKNYTLFFPNGDQYKAAFAVSDYARGGSYDGLETFSVTLLRSGDGIYTHGG